MLEGKPKFILGIDPGNEQSAFCLCSLDLKPLMFAKLPNFEPCEEWPGKKDKFLSEVNEAMVSVEANCWNTIIVIENIESFGMPVGRSVLDTCIYIGELKRELTLFGCDVRFVFRHEEKMAICHSAKANDATIKQALVDRFAFGQKNYGKGTKKEPGFFYGFKADCWSAFAICVTFHDLEYGII